MLLTNFRPSFLSLMIAVACVVFCIGWGGMNAEESLLLASVTLLPAMVKVLEPEEDRWRVIASGRRSTVSDAWSPVDALSAGIAHEINNPLGIIAQETEWLKHLLQQGSFKNISETPSCMESLLEIARQVDRCREIIGKLLSMARQMQPVIQRVDINCLVEEMINLAERSTLERAGVRIVRRLEPGLPAVQSDPPLLRQVALNLLKNALQAIDETGTVIVSTSRTEDSLEITIEDDGCGISEENLKKIFTPFFSTKPEGKGTGLGLLICRGIVELLGGSITVSSHEGKGAAFTVRLPIGEVERQGEA